MPGGGRNDRDRFQVTDRLGLELNARYHAYCWGNLHAEALFGLRYAKLWENTTIRETINPLVNDGFVTFQGNAVVPGETLTDRDSFSTSNQFYGAQIGGRLSWEYRWLSLDTFAKVAMGVNTEDIAINGSTSVLNASGINPTTAGGVLALPSNIGGVYDWTGGLLSCPKWASTSASMCATTFASTSAIPASCGTGWPGLATTSPPRSMPAKSQAAPASAWRAAMSHRRSTLPTSSSSSTRSTSA